jgi:LemA protein
MIWTGIIGGSLALVVIVLIALRNKLVNDQNLVESAFADIDVHLLKRQQLIPSLVAIAKQYAAHEANVLEEVAAMRSGSSASERESLDVATTKATQAFQVVVEAYPDLKANGPFLELMKQLKEIEDQLVFARRFYNGTVRVYNTRIQSFPHSMIASWFNFEKASFYAVSEDGQRLVPSQNF